MGCQFQFKLARHSRWNWKSGVRLRFFTSKKKAMTQDVCDRCQHITEMTPDRSWWVGRTLKAVCIRSKNRSQICPNSIEPRGLQNGQSMCLTNSLRKIPKSTFTFKGCTSPPIDSFHYAPDYIIVRQKGSLPKWSRKKVHLARKSKRENRTIFAYSFDILLLGFLLPSFGRASP